MENIDYLCDYDPEVGQAMQKELDRQRHNIELIAFREYRFGSRFEGNGFGSDE